MLLEEFLKPSGPRKWRPRRAWAFRFSAWTRWWRESAAWRRI